MPEQQDLDIAIYGGQSIEPRSAPSLAEQAVQQYQAPQAVPAANVAKGSALLEQGAANLRANNREEASGLASIGAAVTQWLPAHALTYLKTPDYAYDPSFNAAEAIKNAPIQLSIADEKFLETARSGADFQNRLDGINSRNEAHRAMGDNPILSFVGMALDPAYLAIDIASGGAARLLRGGRGTAGAVAAGLTAGALTAQGEVTPTSMTEIVLGSMLMGAASAAFFRKGRLEPVDPAFPTAELTRVADNVRAKVDDVAEAAQIKREAPLVAPAVLDDAAQTLPRVTRDIPKTTTSARVVLAEVARGRDSLLSVMARHVDNMLVDDVAVHVVDKKHLLNRERAFYDPGEHAIYVGKDTTPETKLHEVTHALTEHKLIYGQNNLDSAHGKLFLQVSELRLAAAKHYKSLGGNMRDGSPTAYYLQNNSEFLAGVFSGKGQFLDTLRSLPVQGTTKTALTSMIDVVRRLLGMPKGQENALVRAIGLTEELAATPLQTTLKSSDGAMLVRAAAPEPHGTDAQILETLRSSKAVASAIEWSWHKTFSNYGSKAKEIADLLMDSPTATAGNSAASIQRALRADLAHIQYKYEGALLDAMGGRGAGLFQRITNTKAATKVQQALERDVYTEMMRRNRAAKDGVKIDAHPDAAVQKMADALDELAARSLKELQEAGVRGADKVAETSGYITRRWDIARTESIERRLLDSGLSPKDARARIVQAMADGIKRSNASWGDDVAQDVAGAIFDRTKRRGMFQDSEFMSGLGQDAGEKLRSLLTAEGLAGARLDRVMEVLAGKADEAGKLPTLKSRVDMDLNTAIAMPDGSEVRLIDMLDTNVSAITERYLDTVSSRAALAQKGMADPSAITALRKELAESIGDVGKRAEAVKSFDDMMDVLQGNPVGEDMLSAMRNIQMVTQMVGLAKSGLWQLTEYSTIMAQYGAMNTMKSLLKEMPFVRNMVKHEADSLREVLVRNSAQDTRLRPFITRMEDNFEIPISDSMKLSLMQAKQLVPYANAMKYIQRHQARTSANLIVDTIVRATKGDAKAAKALEEYGLESGIRLNIADDINKHGMDTTKWSHSTWNDVRGPLTKMMDDAVLRARLGEIPKFAHTSTTGKFLFTFRNFTLAAHNKVLAKTLTQSGYNGLGLLLAYQIPMTVLATQVGAAGSGKAQDEELKTTVAKAMSQVGALGLFTEAFGIVSGNKQQFGSPGLIAVDRMYKLAGTTVATLREKDPATPGDVGAAALNTIPIVAAFLPTKALGEALKSDKEE